MYGRRGNNLSILIVSLNVFLLIDLGSTYILICIQIAIAVLFIVAKKGKTTQVCIN